MLSVQRKKRPNQSDQYFYIRRLADSLLDIGPIRKLVYSQEEQDEQEEQEEQNKYVSLPIPLYEPFLNKIPAKLKHKFPLSSTCFAPTIVQASGYGFPPTVELLISPRDIHMQVCDKDNDDIESLRMLEEDENKDNFKLDNEWREWLSKEIYDRIDQQVDIFRNTKKKRSVSSQSFLRAILFNTFISLKNGENGN